MKISFKLFTFFSAFLFNFIFLSDVSSKNMNRSYFVNKTKHFNLKDDYLNFKKHSIYNFDSTESSLLADSNIQYKEFNKKGIEKYKLKNYRKAIDFFTKAINIKPKNHPDLYFNRGRAYYALQNFSKAINDYEKALEIEWIDPAYFYSMGNAKRKKKEFKSAKSYYTNAILLDSDFAYAFYGRAVSNIELGNFSAGCVDYKKSVNINQQIAVSTWAKEKTYFCRNL